MKKPLSKVEMMALNPTNRDRYARDLVLQTVTDNKEWTIREIARSSGLSRNTILKHLQQLASEQQVTSEEKNLGAFRIRTFRRAGQIKNNADAKGKFAGKRNYTFFTMDSGDGQSVIVQQREQNEVGIENVKGAIAIDFEDLQKFLKELFSFGNKVVNR